MFKKSRRLRLKKDIEEVFKKGKSVYNPYLNLKSKSNNLEYNRILVVVGKKVNKQAVKRNLIKRRLRACLGVFKLQSGFDLMLIAQKKANNASFEILYKEIGTSLKRFNLIK